MPEIDRERELQRQIEAVNATAGASEIDRERQEAVAAINVETSETPLPEVIPGNQGSDFKSSEPMTGSVLGYHLKQMADEMGVDFLDRPSRMIGGKPGTNAMGTAFLQSIAPAYIRSQFYGDTERASDASNIEVAKITGDSRIKAEQYESPLESLMMKDLTEKRERDKKKREETVAIPGIDTGPMVNTTTTTADEDKAHQQAIKKQERAQERKSKQRRHQGMIRF